MTRNRPFTTGSWVFTLLRMAIGWHLLFEGVVKLTAKNWTAAGYLADSTWVLAGFFRRLAESPAALTERNPLAVVQHHRSERSDRSSTC